MKVGDNLYCIKSRVTGEYDFEIHTKGEMYIVTQMYGNSITITCNKNILGFVSSTYIYSDNNSDLSYNEILKIYYGTYFCDMKAYRKLKLKKLNESR